MTHQTPPRPTIQLFAPDRARSAAERLGRADYSYHFVMKYFLPVMRDLGPVEFVDQKDLAGSAADQFLFVPPHALPRHVGERAVPVFAWEYDTIPTDEWRGDEYNDWRRALAGTRAAITHSEYAQKALQRSLPADYPVWSIPAPLWDVYSPLRQGASSTSARLSYSGWLLDSWQMGLSSDFRFDQPTFVTRDCDVELSGIVYTTVVNPDDGRKGWGETLSAFIYAFHDNSDATLVIKVVHHDPVRAGHIICDLLARAAPYACRVVVIFGYLEDDHMRSLIRVSDFVVNSSRGEGQCLPLMEFMSAGVPAISPDHTAMAEYVDASNAFIVRSHRIRTHWPHDPRLIMRCFTYTIDWGSLRDGFASSWQVVTTDSSGYQTMGESASRALERYCSQAIARDRITTVLEYLG